LPVDSSRTELIFIYGFVNRGERVLLRSPFGCTSLAFWSRRAGVRLSLGMISGRRESTTKSETDMDAVEIGEAIGMNRPVVVKLSALAVEALSVEGSTILVID
jgi:hypothetical protein